MNQRESIEEQAPGVHDTGLHQRQYVSSVRGGDGDNLMSIIDHSVSDLKTWNKFTSPYVDFPFLIGSKNPGIARLANDKLCGQDSS